MDCAIISGFYTGTSPQSVMVGASFLQEEVGEEEEELRGVLQHMPRSPGKRSLPHKGVPTRHFTWDLESRGFETH